MKPEQKSIYYITADTLAAARSSPHLEGFRAKGYEVLLLADRVDEWLGAHLHDYEGKPLASVARAAADVEPVIETADKALTESAYKDTLERLAKALAGKVASAQLSGRLTESPACLVAGEHGLSLRMARMLKAAGQQNPLASAPILELNPRHPLVERLKDTADQARFAELAQLLHDQAVLAEGGQLDDPAAFVRQVNRMIVEGFTAAPKIILG
jgi:molecular chaperone HtpG